ncbi:rhodanese-like domain-containing protein [Pseudemcibacter aquimaris]|uniref:rhodanese-like domain-containing protein n=1 Tax=Pseudemcibacter aquimaris TaxID=2857064 RepID=UPI002010EED8|nr:rhodanese-like domain-containing protein [Pseudemcibacter aquimaris]MCC3861900.1 rhodanese-like domain-containing protein [Pseudemcibacter aquimaris]WDU58652.1 rhodanese-like domain-containing protein [Pseudemcibacter aquimaris]
MSGQYKGDVSPAQAWDLLSSDENTVLVDVRTLAEWKCVGEPDLSSLSKNTIYIEWVSFPDRAPNAHFMSQLMQAVPNKDATVLFLCRTGVRSIAAAIAATEMGYENSYNILEGFEGDADQKGHRGRITGWQGRDLPWTH